MCKGGLDTVAPDLERGGVARWGSLPVRNNLVPDPDDAIHLLRCVLQGLGGCVLRLEIWTKNLAAFLDQALLVQLGWPCLHRYCSHSSALCHHVVLEPTYAAFCFLVAPLFMASLPAFPSPWHTRAQAILSASINQ